jgi:predicted enzyme related to lactoylglutathione lyase
MKRMHIHVAVKKIPESIKFYSTMFGVEGSARPR